VSYELAILDVCILKVWQREAKYRCDPSELLQLLAGHVHACVANTDHML